MRLKFPIPLAALVAALAVLAACSSPSAPVPRPSTAGPGVHVLAQRLAMPGLGRERTLRLYLPPSYETAPAKRYPVIYEANRSQIHNPNLIYPGQVFVVPKFEPKP